MAWLVCLVFILIKGELMYKGIFRFLEVDLITIVMAYLLVYYGQTATGIFTLTQGLLMDILSHGPLGLFIILFLITFLSINLGFRLLDLQSPRGQIIQVSLAVLVKAIFFMLLLQLFPIEMDVSAYTLLAFVTSAIISGLLAPCLFILFNYLNQGLVRDKSETL